MPRHLRHLSTFLLESICLASPRSHFTKNRLSFLAHYPWRPISGYETARAYLPESTYSKVRLPYSEDGVVVLSHWQIITSRVHVDLFWK
jgi:hypothetical protein